MEHSKITKGTDMCGHLYCPPRQAGTDSIRPCSRHELPDQIIQQRLSNSPKVRVALQVFQEAWWVHITQHAAEHHMLAHVRLLQQQTDVYTIGKLSILAMACQD